MAAIESGTFYRRPLAGNGSDEQVRYGQQPVGINMLATYMSEIAKRGGLQGNFTNHSGKRTCATELYDAGVDEQEIMERTGHRSVKSVRAYKRRTPAVEKRASDALNPEMGSAPKKTKCETFSNTLTSLSEETNSARPFLKDITSTSDTVYQRTGSNSTCQFLKDITNTSGTQFSGCTFNF